MKNLLFALLILSTVVFAQSTQYLTLGTWNSNGVPNYLEPQNDIITSDFLARIAASLPESKNIMTHHPQYIASTVQSNVVITEPAEVWVTFIGEGAGYKNVLGFYTYNVNNPPNTINDIRNTMTIIFPNASQNGSGGGLFPGNKVKIGQFSPNTVIGWFVIANGYSTGSVGSGNWTFFSNDKLNPETDTTKRKHNVLLEDPVTGLIVLGFEDIKRDGGDNDFNDVLFSIKSNPLTAINIENIPNLENPNASSYADLKVEKIVDNQNPQHGEFVNFSIKVSNLGPARADNIKVTDVLPLGLDYDSYSASKGTYNSSNGLWTISTIAVGEVVTLNLKAKVNLYAATYNLGAASDFNVFVLNDINQPSSDTEGRVAVGNNAYFSNYSIGDKLPNSNGTVDVLIVNGNLTYLSGAVYSGNVVYKNVTNLPVSSVSINNGTLRQDSIINFDAARQDLNNLSNTLKNYTVNGTTEFEFGQIKLTGTNPILNVFSVDGAQLSLANDYKVDVPNGAVVLVNVSGTDVSWTGGHIVHGTAINNVLYNFYEAINLNIHHIDVRGSVLAPKAELDFPTGLISGQVIANNISGIGQFNYEMFLGSIPIDSKIKNSVKITSLDQTDLVDSNNIASVEINAGGTNNPNLNNGGIVNWGQNSSVTNTELIWTLINDQNEMVMGTWGGKIYRSVDNGSNWELINNGMNAAYIWSVIKASAGVYYAGTEHGVYKTTDNGASWNEAGLTNKDVRALVLDNNGNVYAGLWGSGIMKSTDQGNTWSELNNGLTNLNVHTLAFKENIGIFAGTFGGGVYKSDDLGQNWRKLNVGFDHIWTIAISNDNKIYAGTYGDGIYKSENIGETWTAYNSGLTSNHIYSITFDSENNIFVSAWGAGVFVHYNSKSSWKTVGMEGFAVSVIVIDKISNKIFAGTESGSLFSGIITLTDVGNDEYSPFNYELEQNYPNPFNPSTIIKYQIKNAGMVTIKVYDISGREVRTLINNLQNPGAYQIAFNAADLATGVYFYRIVTPEFTSSKKMLLIK